MHLLVAQQRGLVFFFFTNVFFINGAFFHENKMKLLHIGLKNELLLHPVAFRCSRNHWRPDPGGKCAVGC